MVGEKGTVTMLIVLAATVAPALKHSIRIQIFLDKVIVSILLPQTAKVSSTIIRR